MPRPGGGPLGDRPPRGAGERRGAGDRGAEAPQFIEKLISVNRVAKVHKGGKRLSFDALAVVGDGNGRVGMALGKSNETADAIRKGFVQAQRAMVRVTLHGATIPHEIVGKFHGAEVLLQPASPGTGIIAGSAVRAVCEACGIRDVLTKSLGSSNAVNLIRATLQALAALQDADTVRSRRRLSVDVEE